jgi:hypothetical protein
MTKPTFCDVALHLIEESSSAALLMREVPSQTARDKAIAARSLVKEHVGQCPICSTVRDLKNSDE